MADTFLVLRSNNTSPQLFFHDGLNISPTGIGALPGASLESLVGIGGVRTNLKHNNRAFTLLDEIFAIQNGEIYRSTDEAVTFALQHTLTGITTNSAVQIVGPVPVMVSGALRLIGFYTDNSNLIYTFIYNVATTSWSSASTGVSATSITAGATVPVFFNGLLYARIGDAFIGYDPVSTGTVTLTNSGLTNFGSDQIISWNDDLWLGPVTDGAVNLGMAKLQGTTWNLDTGGIDLGGVNTPSGSSKSGVFIDVVAGDLIVMVRTSATLSVFRITPGLVVTDITGTVKGPGLTTLGAFGANTRIWPHITRAPGGTYTVHIYAARGPDTTDPVERFAWIDVLTQITEIGVVGGTGDMAFPYATHGGDYNGFFVGEKRVMQTAQAANPTGITVTFEAFRDSGGLISVRGHYDEVGLGPNSLTLAPMSLSNATGTGGLTVTGINPGAQINNVPTNRTPISFDWDQVSDGFVTGDRYNYQLEGL
jgi:hypothetical protein